MDCQEVGFVGEGINWIDLAESSDRWWALVYAAMTSGSIKRGEFD